MSWWGWATGSKAGVPALDSPRAAAAASLLGKDELAVLQAQFAKALHEGGSPAAGRQQHAPSKAAAAAVLPQLFLQLVCGLPPLHPPLGQALVRAVASGQDGITLEDAVIAVARADRMGGDEALEFAFSLLQESAAAASVSRQRLEAIVLACATLSLGLTPAPQGAPAAGTLEGRGGQLAQGPSAAGGAATAGQSAGSSEASQQQHQQAQQLSAAAAAIAAGALSYGSSGGSGGGSEGGLTLASYRLWAKACPAVHQALLGLLRHVGRPETAAARPPSEEALRAAWAQALPRMAPPAAAAAAQRDTLVTPAWAWALCPCLAPELRREWRLLFHSARDGHSFTTLCGKLAGAAAEEPPPPTLLLVREKGGHLMAGFAPQPWVKSGGFFGDASAFICRLLPDMQVFPATGINDKFQYMGVNNAQLPNGLAFGGAASEKALGQFALYVDATLDAGMSRPMATYGNPSLSSSQVFQVDVVECWALMPSPPIDEAGAASKNKGGASVLDSRAEDRNFMSMAGGAMTQSDGVRRGGQGRPEDDL